MELFVFAASLLPNMLVRVVKKTAAETSSHVYFSAELLLSIILLQY